MRKSYLWSLALATVVVSGAVASSTIAPALTRADGEENEVNYVLDPEPGTSVADLQQLNISFPDFKGVQFDEEMELAIVLKNTETGDEYVCDAPVRNTFAAEGTDFILYFLSANADTEGDENALKPITTPGDYELTIKEGAFFHGDEAEAEDGTIIVTNPVLFPAISATYNVMETIPYVLDPEDGTSAADLQAISITFPDNKNVQVNDKMDLNAIVLTNTETGEEYFCDSPVRDARAAQGTAFTLYFLTTVETESGIDSVLKPITEPGSYKLSIMKGAFFTGKEVEGEDGSISIEDPTPVQAINATYTVGESFAYTLDPEDGTSVADLQTISIAFPENKNILVNEKMELNAIVLTNTETGEEYYCDSPVRDARAPQGSAYKLYFLTTVETEDGIDSELKPITEPGSYKLSIMKGAFISGNEVEGEDGSVSIENPTPVQAITASYTVGETIPYELDPEDGASVADLQTISISFPDNKSVQVNERMDFNAIVLTNLETGEEYYCDSPVRDARASQGVAYTLYFLTSVETEEGFDSTLKPITASGTYKLSIQKGAFLYGDEVVAEDESVTLENPAPVQAISAKYTIGESIVYKLDPENGAYVNDLQTISLSFPENTSIQVNERMAFDGIVLTNTDTGEEYYCDEPVRDTRAEQGTAFTLYFLTTVETETGVESELKPIATPGVYTLSIAKGVFLSGEEVIGEDESVTFENAVPVQAINAVYTVVEAAPEVAYVLDPEDGASVEDLQTITVSFPENKNIQVNERMALNAILLVNTETGEEYYCDEPVRDTRAEQGTAFTLYFMTTVETEDGFASELKPITEAGTYKLTILVGTFLDGTEVEGEDGSVTLENVVPVQEISATYTVASNGVNAVFGAEATEFSVYGVNGIQILKAADSNAVDALPAGLYIINGKKVIKK